MMEKGNLFELIDFYKSENNHNNLENAFSNEASGLNKNYDSILNDLENLLIEYPYFQSARLLYTILLQKSNNTNFIEELSKTALLCADRKKLFYSIQPDNYNKFMKLNENISDNKDRTEELLNSYFNSFSEKSTELSYSPSDYFSYLESLGTNSEENQQEENQLQHQDIIDAFIEKDIFDSFNKNSLSKKNDVYNNNSSTIESHDKDEDSEFLTETLAKIYIKQKKYDKALTIIKRLSLNFPKKSAYFADQIRFLEYLIINDKKNI